MDLIKTIILAIVEGITEFLPISSTGHMVLVSSVLGIQNDKFVKLFEVAIQFGAILAVVALYWKRFFDFSKWQFYLKLLIAVIPALIFGKLFDNLIDEHLGNPTFIATVLLLGGIILVFIDRFFQHPTIDSEEKIDNMTALKIGFFQCLAILFPGLSRSASTIIGGMSQKLTRGLAAEFSFFLAVPTMAAATGYKLLKFIKEEGSLDASQIKFLAIGNVIAFLVAILAIKFFIGVLTKYGFKYFGYYRILVGLIILGLIFSGHQLSVIK